MRLFLCVGRNGVLFYLKATTWCQRYLSTLLHSCNTSLFSLSLLVFRPAGVTLTSFFSIMYIIWHVFLRHTGNLLLFSLWAHNHLFHYWSKKWKESYLVYINLKINMTHNCEGALEYGLVPCRFVAVIFWYPSWCWMGMQNNCCWTTSTFKDNNHEVICLVIWVTHLCQWLDMVEMLGVWTSLRF